MGMLANAVVTRATSMASNPTAGVVRGVVMTNPLTSHPFSKAEIWHWQGFWDAL